MSLITGCPACGTMFRVVPDQLKISEGWVRCGHCSEVFDAGAHMRKDGVAPATVPDALPLPPRPPQRDAAVAAAPDTFEPAGTGVPDHATSEPVSWQGLAAVKPAPADAAAASEPLDVMQPASFAGERIASASAADLPVEENGYLSVDSVRREVEASRPQDSGLAELPSGDQGNLDDVSFLRDARRKAFWRRPGVRMMLVLGVLALASVLGLQAVLHERDRIASTEPHLRPWLERLCQPLGCTLAPPRRIDALMIDSSGFSKVRQDGYRLSFTLRNQAQQPVAVPALELTLTDLQDQPVLRRVLRPGELGATADTLAPSSEWSGAVVLTIESPGSVNRIAGYRLLAFYP